MTDSGTEERAVVCVTGASGFTGSAAVDCLLLSGYSVLATDHPDCGFDAVREHRDFMEAHPDRYRGVTLETVPADLTKPDELVSLFKGRKATYLLHPAAVFSMGAAKKLLWDVNVEGTRNLLAVAAEHAPNLLGVAIWSTAMVYGRPRHPGPMTEDETPRPTNLYARSKLEEERVALEFEKQGMPVVILRPTSVYGPRGAYGLTKRLKPMSWASVFPVVPIPGSGESLAHLAHIDDVAAAALHLVYIMGHLDISGEVFNIADDTPLAFKDLMFAIAEILRLKKPTLHVPEPVVRLAGMMIPYGYSTPFFGLEREELPSLFWNTTYDNTKLKRTGYTLKYPNTRAGLEATFDWYARNKQMERIWYLTHPGWRDYWRHLAPEDRPFADYALLENLRRSIS